jgi:hypothetical protein
MSGQAEPLLPSEIIIFPLRDEPQDSVVEVLDTQKLKRIIEAALLTATEPLSIAELKKLNDVSLDHRQLETLLEELTIDWQGRGVELTRVANGWRFRARPEQAKSSKTSALLACGTGNPRHHYLSPTRHPWGHRGNTRGGCLCANS